MATAMHYYYISDQYYGLQVCILWPVSHGPTLIYILDWNRSRVDALKSSVFDKLYGSILMGIVQRWGMIMEIQLYWYNSRWGEWKLCRYHRCLLTWTCLLTSLMQLSRQLSVCGEFAHSITSAMQFGPFAVRADKGRHSLCLIPEQISNSYLNEDMPFHIDQRWISWLILSCGFMTCRADANLMKVKQITLIHNVSE